MGENTTSIVPPFWADEACRLAEAARAAPWAESAGAAMVAAAAHSARWLATAASDPAVTAQFSHIEQLSQAASEAWDRVLWVQRAAAQAGCVGRGCRSLETVATSGSMGEWGRRVAAAGAVARRLARVTGVTLPTYEVLGVSSRAHVFEELPPRSLDSPPEDSVLSDSMTSSETSSHALVEPHELIRAQTAPAGSSRGEVAVAAPVGESVPEEVDVIPPPDTTEVPLPPPSSAPVTAEGPRAAETRRPKSERHSARHERRRFMATVRIVLYRVFKMRTLAAAAAFVLAILLLLANSPGVNPIASWGHSQLALDLEAFESLLAVPRVKSLVLRTMRTDPDVHRALRYMGTARFRRRCLIIEAMPEVQQLSQLLAADGVGLRTTLRAFNERMELTYSRIKARKVKRKSKAGEEPDEIAPRGSLKPLFQELQSALPAKQIQGLYKLKMTESEPFRRFIEYIQGPEGEIIGRKLKHTKEYEEVMRTLRDRDLTEHAIFDYVGWLFVGTTEEPSQPNKNHTVSANATEDK